MADIFSLESKIKQMIDELKGLSATNGLANQASEEVVITSVFLYKFLNDKFMSNLKDFAKDTGMTTEEVLKNENDELDAFYDSYPQDVAFKYEDTIEFLINRVSSETFYKLFDDALERISNYPQNEEFSVQSAEGTRKPLFTRITENVESSKRNNFAKNIFGIISQDRFDFGDAFKSNFDFYSTIFEYLIKDYNVAAGKYAEYFTPQTISSIIAKILVNMSPVEDKIYEVYDPSAGSGSLVLHLANELGKGNFGDKAQVYTQDISAKPNTEEFEPDVGEKEDIIEVAVTGFDDDPVSQAISAKISQKDKSFYEQLILYIDAKELTDVQVYKAAHIDKRVFSTMRSKTKNKKKRKIPLNVASVMIPLDLWYMELGSPDLSTRIFDWTDSNARSMIQKACEKKGIQKHTCHDFRHTFISNLMADPTVSLADIEMLSGDTQETILARYSHMLPDAKRKFELATNKW